MDIKYLEDKMDKTISVLEEVEQILQYLIK